MRKLSLLATLILAASVANADLGQIKVQSFLYQPLNATIPITNVADGDYTNLVINLADAMQFKNNGVEYNTELGLLQFRVVNIGHTHYLKITSAKPISAPVLNVLLHYREGDNDYYRQYTIQLNPINYSAVGYANAGANGVKGRDNPIAIGRVANINTKKVPTNKFAPNYTSSFVKEYLNRYDPTDLTFRLESGDSLYMPIKFTQLLYPKLYLTTNQVAVALGLVNYPNLHDKNYIYESTVLINMVTAKQVVKLPIKPVDEYVWRSDVDTINRSLVLNSFADDLNVEIDKNNSELFLGIASTSPKKKVASNVAVNKITSSKDVINAVANQDASKIVSSAAVKKAVYTPPVYQEPSTLDLLNEYLYEIAGAVALLLLVAYVLIRRKKVKKPVVQPASAIEVKIQQKHDDIIFEDLQPIVTKAIPQPVVASQPVIVKEAPKVAVVVTAPKIEPISTVVEHIEVTPVEFTPEVTFEPVQEQVKFEPIEPVAAVVIEEKKHDSKYDDIISQLEMILSIDSSRNDLKLKLLEVNIEAGNLIKAQYYLDDLESNLDFDDNLRQNLQKMAQQNNLTYNANLGMHSSDNHSHELDGTHISPPEQHSFDSVDVSLNEASRVDNHSIEFSSPSFTEDSLAEITIDNSAFESNHDDLMFNATSNSSETELDSSKSNDELIGDAVRLCMDSDYAQAKQILSHIANSANSTAEQKDSVQKLMEFYKLNV